MQFEEKEVNIDYYVIMYCAGTQSYCKHEIIVALRKTELEKGNVDSCIKKSDTP
jgi:hypothetical protein